MTLVKLRVIGLDLLASKMILNRPTDILYSSSLMFLMQYKK